MGHRVQVVRAIITGGKGQLGRAVEEALAKHEIIAPGHETLDVTDGAAAQRLISELRPDLVVHCAAWTDTAACEREPQRAMVVNGEAPGIVAAACHEAGAAMLYVSSNEVFDGEKGSPYDEDDATGAINEYGRSKLEGEHRVRDALAEHYIVRMRAAREQGSLRAVTDEIASPTWTFDLAEAIAKLIDTQAWGTYHLTNSGYCSRLEWARAILDLSGLQVPVEPATLAEFGAPYRKPAFSALANNNGARLAIALRPWRDALSDHLRWGEAQQAAAGPPSQSGNRK
ncbi:MAG: sugar nucleotide-binding protein [Chloroflexi bacterium]|nr:MAG: sugar nucleotide-binding protein [Chloroflexota bacterium]